MKTFRQRLGKRLVGLGYRMYGDIPQTETAKLAPPKTINKMKGGAVVEATDELVQWSPDQRGNVVIAEPDMLTKFRREKHDDDLPSMQ